MEAIVTLKVQPSEFDLLRRALRSYQQVLKEQTKNAAPSDLSALRGDILETDRVLTNLSGR